MTVSMMTVRNIEAGARTAQRLELHRLGGLLQAVGELASEVYQGQIGEAVANQEIILTDMFDFANKVSNDLMNGEAKAKEAEALDLQGRGL